MACPQHLELDGAVSIDTRYSLLRWPRIDEQKVDASRKPTTNHQEEANRDSVLQITATEKVNEHPEPQRKGAENYPSGY